MSSPTQTSLHRPHRTAETLLLVGCWAATGLMLAIGVWMLADIVLLGWRRLSWGYLVEAPRQFGRAGGIGPILVSTTLILSICLCVAVPLGLSTAAWLSEFGTRQARLRQVIQRSLDLLASVPSILFGLFGMACFCQWMKLGFSILAGGLTLSLMILPLIVAMTYSGLQAVPSELRRGAVALGLTQTTILWRLLLPQARPRILAGVLLGIGRALAETAALIFTSGYVTRLPRSWFDSGRTLSVHIYDLSMNMAGGRESAAAAACTLLAALILINWSVRRISSGLRDTGHNQH